MGNRDPADPHRRGSLTTRLARDCLRWARRRVKGPRRGRMDELAELRSIEQAAQDALVDEVADGRAAGHSWHEIGAALGMTRQSAHKRYARAHRDDPGREGEPLPGDRPEAHTR